MICFCIQAVFLISRFHRDSNLKEIDILLFFKIDSIHSCKSICLYVCFTRVRAKVNSLPSCMINALRLVAV